jgi:hypothetical protein
MKHFAQLIITAVMLTMAQTAGAQKTIETEFEVFAKMTNGANLLSSSASQDTDLGKSTVFRCIEFNVDKDDPQFKQLINAFETDAKDAYDVFAKSPGTTERSTVRIEYGSFQKANTSVVTFGSYSNHNYRVLLFRDPTDKFWRTCYALAWYKRSGDGNKYHGFMYHIYSRDPRLVGKEKQSTTVSMLNDGSMIQYDSATGLSTVVQSSGTGSESGAIKTSVDFLSRFNLLRSMYMEKIDQAGNPTSLTYCTSVVNNLLSLCKQHASLLNSDEKMACRNILNNMLQHSKDTGLREMIALATKYLN